MATYDPKSSRPNTSLRNIPMPESVDRDVADTDLAKRPIDGILDGPARASVPAISGPTEADHVALYAALASVAVAACAIGVVVWRKSRG